MEKINISQFEDSFVIHFGLESNRINAYTLASTLVNLADAAKAANNTINPGYDIEVVVEAIGPGSFKAKIKTLYKGASNLFSKDTLKQIVLNLIASYIFLHTIQPDSNVTINVNTTEVVIQDGDKQYIVPRYVYDSLEDVKNNPRFTNGVSRAIKSVEEDPDINSFGLSKDMEDSKPTIDIQRDSFSLLSDPIIKEEKDTRIIEEIAEVEITKAILTRSSRKWEFVWNGMKLSAPVTDSNFYDDFFDHRITIAPGDALRVRLRIHQKKMPDVGVYVNQIYEVSEVIKHIPRQKDSKLNLP
ncbi:hypothetical protein ACFLS9_02985 [Bacteroidota bacterium]